MDKAYMDFEWKIKPIANYYQLNNNLNMCDTLLQLAWKDIISLSVGICTNGAAIGSLGLNMRSFAIHYAYYSQMSGMMKLAPVQNEIAVSFSIIQVAATK